MFLSPIDKLYPQYNTQVIHRKRIDQLEQENRELRDEVTNLKDILERLNNMMEVMAVAQNQPSPNSQETLQRTIIFEIVSAPVSITPCNIPQYHMPIGRPWGMPPNFMSEGYHPQVTQAPVAIAIMSMPPPVVYATPYQEDHIYHTAPSENVGVDEKLYEFQDQFLEMQKEIKALCGQDLFGKNASDLCLVPNVKIPLKFKVYPISKSTRGIHALRVIW